MAGPTRVLELRSVRGTGGGPEKTILLSAERADRSRLLVTVCYIRDLRDDIFDIGERARRAGVDYVEVTERHSFDPSIWRALRRIIHERKIDIVHAHDYKTDFLTWALAKVEPVVPLSTAHGWSRSSWREFAYYFADKCLLARFPLVIAVSEPIRKTLMTFGAHSTRVRRISNAIDPDAFRRAPGLREAVRAEIGVTADECIVGSVGRLERVKRFDLLIEAVALLKHRKPVIVIAGEGSCRATLEERAKALGVGDRLRLLGLRRDVKRIYHTFDAYVQSSETEGVSNSVLEAMSLEVPIVATDVGGSADLVENAVHGLLVPRHDVRALSAAIEQVFRDPVSAAARVAAARRRVEDELSFDARTKAVEAVYDELMERRSSNVSA
jgi:glycosyltransferase involved in cell wall biosynthesis